MKMPTTTTDKVEPKAASTEVFDAGNQCILCLEKKVRNLEKRKAKIEISRDKAQKGTKLEKEQEVSLKQYDQVAHNLEFARELHKQFLCINVENEKILKKQAKKEKIEKQAAEIKRVTEILQLQATLDQLGGDKVRQDFKTGKHGAVVLSEDNLNQLDELYQVISPSREDSPDEYPKRLTAAAEHLVSILDGRDRQIAGTTYKELKDLLGLITNCGYFDASLKNRQNASATKEKKKKNKSEKKASQNSKQTKKNTPTELSSESVDQQPIDLTVNNSEGSHLQENAPQTINTIEQDAFFAPNNTAYNLESESSQFSQTESHARNAARIPDFQSFTSNRPFQFIQTSYVMPDSSAPAAVDPAVIAAQPAGASGLQFMSPVYENVAPSQQSSQSSGQSAGPLGVQGQGQRQPQTADYPPQAFAQTALTQNLQAEGLFNNPGVGVDGVASKMPTHSGMLSQRMDDGVKSSSYEIPPSIPMPPSQSQEQTELDQQQQEKKFQMNASAPVFTSMYPQVGGGNGSGVNMPPSTMQSGSDGQNQPQMNDFSSSSANGEFRQAGQGDFHQSYDNVGSNGFQSGSNYQRGGGNNRNGYRGGATRQAGNGSTANRPQNGSGMQQNGFIAQRGNHSAGRGGRGGSFQGFPPSNNYRPDSFQGTYNTSNFNQSFQKRSGMSHTGATNASYARASVPSNQNRGGMRGGMMRAGGGNGNGARGGGPRVGFNRPPN